MSELRISITTRITDRLNGAASIVAAVNHRLELVTALWELKSELGLDTVDPDRERRLRETLAEANGGPLSEEGLDRLVSELLDLTKKELGA